MAIRITAQGDLYVVSLTPPEHTPWRSSKRMSATEVLAQLSELGCHSTDITDALSAANPNWAASHDDEVRRRRNH